MRRDAFYYFKKSVAFFDIRAKALPPVIFLIILALYAFYMYVMQYDIQAFENMSTLNFTAEVAAVPVQSSLMAMLLGIAIMFIVNLISFVYLDAVVREIKNVDYTARDCLYSVLRHLPGLTGLSIIKNIIVGAGLFFFLIPGIFLAILLLFSECAILDGNKHVIESMRVSRELTNRKRGEIFRIELFCNLIIAVFVLLLLSIFASYNLIVFQYIMMFTLSICKLIEHKLVALLYIDVIAANEKNRDIAEVKKRDDGDENIEE